MYGASCLESSSLDSILEANEGMLCYLRKISPYKFPRTKSRLSPICHHHAPPPFLHTDRPLNRRGWQGCGLRTCNRKDRSVFDGFLPAGMNPDNIRSRIIWLGTSHTSDKVKSKSNQMTWTICGAGCFNFRMPSSQEGITRENLPLDIPFDHSVSRRLPRSAVPDAGFAISTPEPVLMTLSN